MKRQAGILMPVSALPSDYGIGCFSKEAYEFADLLAESGQSVWQILPLCPTSYGDSPYQSPCSFAGNPYFIDPATLVTEGLLTSSECESLNGEGDSPDRIDYGRLYETRYRLLRAAYERFKDREKPTEYSVFITENAYWLYDYALYTAIKTHLGGAPLSAWSEDIRRREPSALSEYRKRLASDIDFHIFLQFKFFSQWKALKSYANQKGISILGDLPIYVSADSSDLWVDPTLFELDESGRPLSVAGCPPDVFSPLGQLWGNPLYNWRAHRESGYSWWKRRVFHAFEMYDILRIDHFRGFEAYYSVPYGAEDARQGHWERGVGHELFAEIKKSLGKREIIAEDLGYITDGVRNLVKDQGFSGMKILQFGFNGGDGDFSSEYLPHNYCEKSVVYTGTHDNPTLSEWLENLSEGSEQMLREYICDFTTPTKELSDKLISLAMQSVSELCIIPLQDYLCIGHEGRMNTPSSASGNWVWRVKKENISKNLSMRVKYLTNIGGRLNF